MPTETKTIVSRITAYGRRPTSPVQALKQARALLAEEGKWCTGELFQDGDAGEAFENGSICGSWQACAVGAIGLVTGEMQVEVRKEWEPFDEIEAWIETVDCGETLLGFQEWKTTDSFKDLKEEHEHYEWVVPETFSDRATPLTDGAVKRLVRVLNDEDPDSYNPPNGCDVYSDVFSFNDDYADSEDVLRVFDKAIALKLTKGM